MTGFMTAFHLVLVQLPCPGDQRVKAVHVQSVCTRCRESHKTQVWLCFLVVSFLTISTCAISGQNIADFKECVKEMRKNNTNILRKSDAMLYAPSIDDIERNCEYVSLKCYTEELMMVLDEEEIKFYTDCIFEFNKTLNHPSVGCPVCETYPLKNITIFLKRLDTLLEKLITQNNV